MTPTVLYALAPLGLGTLDAESLTGYVRRLAVAHLVSIAQLIALVLGPTIAHRRSSVKLPDIGCALNGAEVMTRRLVDRLEG